MSSLAVLGGTPVRTQPFPRWPQAGAEEEQALVEVLRSGAWFEHRGTQVKKFEELFAAVQDAKYGITTNSGTNALWLALHAAGVRPGHEVIVPAYTFVATATSVLMAGAVPVFCDVDTATWNLDPAGVERLITARTRAIVPVHFGGYLADLDALEALAKRHGLMVIEDAAHAHGGIYRGRKLGAQGLAGAFSFQESKNITAGEGGIVLTDHEELLDAMYGVKMYGRPRQGGVWYEHARFGGNFRMTEFQAAILRVQLTRLEGQTQTRLANARILEAGFRGLPGQHSQGVEDPRNTRRAYHLFLWRHVAEEAGGLSREAFLKALVAEGIPAWSGYNRPLQQQPLFTDRPRLGSECPTACLYDGQTPDYAAVSTPVTARLCSEQACWLPQPNLLGSADDTRDILRAVEKVLTHRDELLSTGRV